MTRSFARIAVAVAAAATGCSNDTQYVVVTVASQPAVHDATSLTVALTNAGTTRMDTLALRGQAFPVTFSVSAPGRAGDLAIAIDATDDAGVVVGHGTGTAPLTADAAAVMLASTDFVVNTDYAGDQFPTDDFEASGFQLTASPGGTWTSAFRSCMASSCTMFARQLDPTGKPVQTIAAAGTNAFALSTMPTTLSSQPAIASGATTTLAIWDYYDPAPTSTTHGVACRALDATGRASPDQQTSTAISADSADVVSIAALGNGNFIAAWTTFATTEIVHASIIKPDCTPVTPVATPLVVSTGTLDAHRAAVAVNGDQILFAWIVAGDLHVRTATAAGVLGADTLLVPKAAPLEIEYTRLAPLPGGGFAVGVRWDNPMTDSAPGKLELYRYAAGKLVGAATLITDKSGSDFDNSQSFALAAASNGTVLAAWHTCGDLGDGSMCGVFGQFFDATGAALGTVITIPTTTEGDQKLPSAVALPDGSFAAAWSDASARAPDVAGTAVRARILYPPAAAAGPAAQPAASSSAR